jgi:hypothetical protein
MRNAPLPRNMSRTRGEPRGRGGLQPPEGTTYARDDDLPERGYVVNEGTAPGTRKECR